MPCTSAIASLVGGEGFRGMFWGGFIAFNLPAMNSRRSRIPIKNAGEKYQHAADHDLKRRLQERRIHKFIS